MTKSKLWSEKDLKEVDTIIKSANTRSEGINQVAEKLGITPNAVRIRYGRWLNGLKGKKKASTKLPIVRKTTKKKSPKVKSANNQVTRSLTFDIKDVSVDLAKGKLTIIY